MQGIFYDYIDERNTLKSINDLLGRFGEILSTDLLLFRGEPDEYPSLIPSIGRCNFDAKFMEKQYLKYFQELERKSARWSSEFSSKIENIMYAQHYGAKTQLLDWTKNPLVALFFAVAPKKYDHFTHDCVTHDCVLWAFYCEELSIKSTETLSDKKYIDLLNFSDDVFVIYPRYIDSRIAAQQSVFSLHLNPRKNFTEFFEKKEIEVVNASHSRLAKFKIHKDYRKQIFNQLGLLGINFETVLTDFPGLVKQLNFEYLSEDFNL